MASSSRASTLSRAKRCLATASWMMSLEWNTSKPPMTKHRTTAKRLVQTFPTQDSEARVGGEGLPLHTRESRPSSPRRVGTEHTSVLEVACGESRREQLSALPGAFPKRFAEPLSHLPVHYGGHQQSAWGHSRVLVEARGRCGDGARCAVVIFSREPEPD